jgi:aspartate/methionine/tyrosine aminotransferase
MIAECWTQHDYVTICPNKMSDEIARVAVMNRDRCYARTRALLIKNLEIGREWVASFNGFLEWREPQAGAIALVKYHSETPSAELCERMRVRQSTLVVPGAFVQLEGYLRIWLGGREEYLREGLRRIGLELGEEISRKGVKAQRV